MSYFGEQISMADGVVFDSVDCLEVVCDCVVRRDIFSNYSCSEEIKLQSLRC